MSLLIGSLTIGLILSLLAFGILISFRIVGFEDLTVDGSLTLGGATAAALIAMDCEPVFATALGAAAGAAAGGVTGILHHGLAVNRLLSGILVMTALYSVNLRIMGKSNVPLLNRSTVFGYADQWSLHLFGDRPIVSLFGWETSTKELSILMMVTVLVVIVAILLFAFFRSHLGLAMSAVGDNRRMVPAIGGNVGLLTVTALCLANGLIGSAGALMAQYQGFADVQMGIGMLVWGVAAVILGESLVQSNKVGLLIIGAVMGSILFRLLVAIALRWGLNPNDLKLITALAVLVALVIPNALANAKKWVGRLNRA